MRTPFFTNSTEPVADADITHRRHAVVETLFADLVDGPFAHVPSGSFQANTAWVVLAAITHNLLRAAGTLAGTAMGVARGATLRRHLVMCPPGSPARKAGPRSTGRPLAPRHSMEQAVGQRLRLQGHRSSRGLTTNHRPPQARPEPELRLAGSAIVRMA